MADDASSGPPHNMAVETQQKPAQPKPMRKHSRLGCSNCKLRKVKCDEGRPACHNCTLRRAECSFTTDRSSGRGSTQPRWLMTPASMSPFGIEDAMTPVINQPLFYPPSVDRVDMKLLWHYTSNTYKSLSYSDDMQASVERTCQTVIVQHAFGSPFLLQSILELASLHMQSLGQQSDASRALMYRVRSYQGYLEAINEACPKTFGALQANAVLLPMLATHYFRDPSSPDLYLLDWMLLWQGVTSILHMTGKSSMAETGMEPLFARPSLSPNASLAAIPKQLFLMISFIDPGEQDATEIQTYLESLRALASLFENVKEPVNSFMVLRIITWSTVAPRRLVELAQAGRQQALVILAYYAVYLKLVQDIWWLKGVGDRSLRDICHALEPSWHKYLRIPLSALVVEDATKLSRVITSSEENYDGLALHIL